MHKYMSILSVSFFLGCSHPTNPNINVFTNSTNQVQAANSVTVMPPANNTESNVSEANANVSQEDSNSATVPDDIFSEDDPIAEPAYTPIRPVAVPAAPVLPSVEKQNFSGKPFCGPAYAHYSIISDPPGAYVFNGDGDYLGQTAKNTGLELISECQNGAIGPDDGSVVVKACDESRTITLKKRGYNTVTQTFTLHFRLFRAAAYASDSDCRESEAKAWKYPPWKVMVVMDTGE